MARLEKSIVISAPVEHVFRYLADPSNYPTFWPSMCEVRGVQQLPSGGKRFEWTYKMAGVRFEGISETVDFKFADHITVRSRGGIESTFTWLTEPLADGRTRVTLNGEYRLPSPLLGRLREEVIASQNEREAELMLANLRLIVEQVEAHNA